MQNWTICFLVCMFFFTSCSTENSDKKIKDVDSKGVKIHNIQENEDVFSYVKRIKGKFDHRLYQQVVGAANSYKEGDEAIEVHAKDEKSRINAQTLLGHTKIKSIHDAPLYEDELQKLIWKDVKEDQYQKIQEWTLQELKAFLLEKTEEEIKSIMHGLNSDVIACVVRLMSNEELISVGKKVFNPLPDSKIGAKGYMGARIQPNSPTDNVDDVVWQVFNGFSFATGDVVLGTNPVDSSLDSVHRIEVALKDILTTFKLEEIMPWCVLAHVDVQARVESENKDSVALLFQSLAGTDDANKTFDISIDKMLHYAETKQGKYGLYFETGQGADFTNGAAHGFDMVAHESRKYGFARVLKGELQKNNISWLHLNDVAGFIGPEVFQNKEQLVRCCLEDIVMGKLHGLCIGLDICSTLHMPVTLSDLDWCIDEIMPANPAYLMALPTKNDPMLSYLTTGFQDHVRLREKFGYKVNDDMWKFFQDIEIIDKDGKFTEHAGDPIWVYYQYLKRKGDMRSQEEIYAEGQKKVQEVIARGVPLSLGHGENVWDMDPKLKAQIEGLYQDAKTSLWAEFTPEFIKTIPDSLVVHSSSEDRNDYVAHPVTGENLSEEGKKTVKGLKKSWEDDAQSWDTPDVQVIISDGLNARALMDDDHLLPYLDKLKEELEKEGLSKSNKNIVVINGRVRIGYQIGSELFDDAIENKAKGIIHIIGERPGTGHHNYSVYLVSPTGHNWKNRNVDHDIGKVISGISDTSLSPKEAAVMTVKMIKEMMVLEEQKN